MAVNFAKLPELLRRGDDSDAERRRREESLDDKPS
jgi:hypothetical protein